MGSRREVRNKILSGMNHVICHAWGLVWAAGQPLSHRPKGGLGLQAWIELASEALSDALLRHYLRQVDFNLFVQHVR